MSNDDKIEFMEDDDKVSMALMKKLNTIKEEETYPYDIPRILEANLDVLSHDLGYADNGVTISIAVSVLKYLVKHMDDDGNVIIRHPESTQTYKLNIKA